MRIFILAYILLSCNDQQSITDKNNVAANSRTAIRNEIKLSNYDTSRKNTQKQFYKIVNYSVNTNSIKNKPGFITLREFTDSITKKKYFLAINVQTLETKILNYEDVTQSKELEKLKNSTYFKLIDEVSRHNNSFTGLNTTKNQGYVLTLDLCPSTKYFDKTFYDFLINSKISPIYLSVSGKWIENHSSELNYIVKNNKSSQIIWANHSYSHYYDPKKDNKKNFMLNPKTNVENEVLSSEKIMIENGLIPSVSFPIFDCI